MLTRPAGRGEGLVFELERLGATVDSRPTIALSEPRDPAAVEGAVDRLSEYDWLVFTSPSGVRFFGAALERSSVAVGGLRAGVAAIGAGTRRALLEIGLTPLLVAEDSRSEGMARTVEGQLHPGQRVLLVRPEVARPLLPDALRQTGAQVDVVAFYRNDPAPGVEGIARDVLNGQYQVAVFTSPSTLRRLLEAAVERRAALVEALTRVGCVAIGEVTGTALKRAGIPPGAVARQPTDEGLLDAVRSLFPA